jgi:hypothetical protein
VIYLNELSGDDWEKSKEATLRLAELAGISIKRFDGKNEIIDYLQTKVNIRK